MSDEVGGGVSDERETALLSLLEHPAWKVYEEVLGEWRNDATALLLEATDYATMLRLQGNIEALEHVVDFKNKWSREP